MLILDTSKNGQTVYAKCDAQFLSRISFAVTFKVNLSMIKFI